MSICVQFLLFVAVYLAPRVHKTRKYPHGEPKIEFTTLQTTVVYKHNILNTISPFIFYNFFFSRNYNVLKTYFSMIRSVDGGRNPKKILMYCTFYETKMIVFDVCCCYSTI